TSEAESRIFAEFWTWFSGLQRDCENKGLTFAAYCFYEQAENGAMRRAVTLTPAITPPWNEVSNFLTSPKWVDLHNTAKECIQTEGPLGLKVLAPYAGFHWRDEAPGGEASMVWYETATASDDETALASRQRILEYNEDDCHATRYLRDWINTEAKLLPSRDEMPAAQ
ncbi:MAG: recombinase RecB, partial [Actinobacteria bacterium]|nr:recombinase RecB [Actinomycetota bacterium]